MNYIEKLEHDVLERQKIIKLHDRAWFVARATGRWLTRTHMELADAAKQRQSPILLGNRFAEYHRRALHPRLLARKEGAPVAQWSAPGPACVKGHPHA